MNRILYTCYKIVDVETLKTLFPPVFPQLYYHHCTIQFGTQTPLPKLNEGKRVILPAIGRLTTDSVDCLVIHPEYYCGNNSNPHITLSTNSGISPARCNVELELNPDLIVLFATPVLIDTQYTTVYAKKA